MKQQKLSGYQPNYPKKAIRGMTLAAAAHSISAIMLGVENTSSEPLPMATALLL